MKKFYSFLSIVAPFMFLTAQAQSNFSAVPMSPISVPSFKGHNPSTLTIDTMMPATFSQSGCDTLFYYRLSGGKGYVFGNNNVSTGETECAQKYYATGTVTEVLVGYGVHKGTNGVTSAKVYSIDGTKKGPLNALGTSSNTITTGAIVTTAYNSYVFTPGIAVTTSFAVGVTFPSPTGGDSVAVLSTKIGCSSTDSLSWVKIGTWIATGSFLQGHPNVDLAILPIVNVAGGVNEYPSANGLTLMGAYPNPANDFTNIKYHINTPGVVSVEVFDLTGRVIQHSSEKFSSGDHDIKLSVRDLASGNYYYTIKTDAAQLTSKFSVAK